MKNCANSRSVIKSMISLRIGKNAGNAHMCDICVCIFVKVWVCEHMFPRATFQAPNYEIIFKWQLNGHVLHPPCNLWKSHARAKGVGKWFMNFDYLQLYVHLWHRLASSKKIRKWWGWTIENLPIAFQCQRVYLDVEIFWRYQARMQLTLNRARTRVL